VNEARKYRKMVGGGMRQAGILAAAGVVALTEMVDRLAEDHANARFLAESIGEMPGARVDLESVQTNIVVIDIQREDMTAAQFAARLGELGVKTNAIGGSLIRMVTHHDVSRADAERAVQAAREVLGR